jgi:poly-gamma-glutamate system protein
MKLFWRPSNVSPILLVLVAIASVGGYVIVESYRITHQLPYHRSKVRASRLTQKAFEAVKQTRAKLRIPIDEFTDPNESGLIGKAVSQITSKSGQLPAKQSTLNPNWAAVFVDLYKGARLRKGDTIAMALSGSFPALNIAALAACKTMELEPIILSSVSASMFGANHRKLTWLDMEKSIRDAGLWDYKSVAASYGGIQDIGHGISRKGIRQIKAAIKRNKVDKLTGGDCDTQSLENPCLAVMIEKRINMYKAAAGGTPIRAYINVGGGIASVGSLRHKKSFRSGLNIREPDGGTLGQDGVMHFFLRKDIPVIHISRIKRLANRYNLPWLPPTIPKPGFGGVFYGESYATWLVWCVLIGIVLALFAITRMDTSFLFRRVFNPRKGSSSGPGV